MNYTKEQINKMRELLAQRDLESSDDITLFDTFLEGCTGWNNFTDEYVVEEFFNYFSEDELKDYIDGKPIFS